MKWLFYVIISFHTIQCKWKVIQAQGNIFSISLLLLSNFWNTEVSSGCANHWGKMSAPNMHSLNVSERWYTVWGCNPHVTEADPETLSDCSCQRWQWESASAPATGLLTALLSLKLSVSERTSLFLIVFSEHALLFNGWWNVIKEHIHYPKSFY